uniref:Peptidase A1 domain-containing protein n=1 Tax=Arundo donax TaxID=35708 RepID=A0A0A9E199_ARUDO
MVVFGDIALSNKLVVYDLENQVVGWADHNYKFLILKWRTCSCLLCYFNESHIIMKFSKKTQHFTYVYLACYYDTGSMSIKMEAED